MSLAAGLKVLMVVTAVGVGGYRYYDHGSLSAAKVTTTTQSTAAPVAAQVFAQNPQASADTAYLQTYMTSMQRTVPALPFGATVQNISLPSGRAMTLTVQKTKTGWCPLRNEPTYSVSINATSR